MLVLLNWDESTVQLPVCALCARAHVCVNNFSLVRLRLQSTCVSYVREPEPASAARALYLPPAAAHRFVTPSLRCFLRSIVCVFVGV